MSDAHEDHHPHPEGEGAVVEPPPPDPHYEVLNTERKAEADEATAFMNALQKAYDENLIAVLGEGMYQIARFMLSQQVRLLHLEQRLEELESKHRRHYHNDNGLATG